MSQESIDIWQIDLQEIANFVQADRALVSAEEWCRYKQIARPVQAMRYFAGRWALRHVLAGYISIPAEQLVFVKGAYGKPVLQGGGLFFNVTHSADTMLIAVSKTAEVGVDVELVRERGNLTALVSRCFAIEEERFFNQLQDTEQLSFFYTLWVAKEAFVKAVGRGLALGLSNCALNVPQLDGFVSVPNECGSAADWSLRYIELDNDCKAAVVSRADRAKINLRTIKKPL